MKKTDAIRLLGGSRATAAKEIGVTVQAIGQWPEVLPPKISDRVLAVLARKHLPQEMLVGAEGAPFAQSIESTLQGRLEMNDIAKTRRQNFNRLLLSRGWKYKDLVRNAGKTYSFWRDLLTNDRKSFGEKLARCIEESLTLPSGWLDEQANPPGAAPTVEQSPCVNFEHQMLVIERKRAEAMALLTKADELNRQMMHEMRREQVKPAGCSGTENSTCLVGLNDEAKAEVTKAKQYMVGMADPVHALSWASALRELDSLSPRSISAQSCRQKLAVRRRSSARSKVPVRPRRTRVGSPVWSVPSAGQDLILLYAGLAKTADGQAVSPRSVRE